MNRTILSYYTIFEDLVDVLEELQTLTRDYAGTRPNWDREADVLYGGIKDLRDDVAGHLHQLEDPRATWGVDPRYVFRSIGRNADLIFQNLPDTGQSRLGDEIIALAEQELDPLLGEALRSKAALRQRISRCLRGRR